MTEVTKEELHRYNKAMDEVIEVLEKHGFYNYVVSAYNGKHVITVENHDLDDPASLVRLLSRLSTVKVDDDEQN